MFPIILTTISFLQVCLFKEFAKQAVTHQKDAMFGVLETQRLGRSGLFSPSRSNEG